MVCVLLPRSCTFVGYTCVMSIAPSWKPLLKQVASSFGHKCTAWVGLDNAIHTNVSLRATFTDVECFCLAVTYTAVPGTHAAAAMLRWLF